MSLTRKKMDCSRRSRGGQRKDGWEGAFLDTLWRTGRKGLAARGAGIALRTVERRQHSDPGFSALVARACADTRTDRLIARANERPTVKNVLAVLTALRPEEWT